MKNSLAKKSLKLQEGLKPLEREARIGKES